MTNTSSDTDDESNGPRNAWGWGMDESRFPEDETLAEILLAGESAEDKDADKHTLNSRKSPRGVQVAFRTLGQAFKIGKTQVIRQATRHGLSYLREQGRVQRLKADYDMVRDRAFGEGDEHAMHLLETSVGFEFLHNNRKSAPIYLYENVDGEISELAEIFGMDRGSVAYICAILSLQTVENIEGREMRGLMKWLNDELVNFYIALDNRHSQFNRG